MCTGSRDQDPRLQWAVFQLLQVLNLLTHLSDSLCLSSSSALNSGLDQEQQHGLDTVPNHLELGSPAWETDV